LKEALAGYLGVREENITLGNGSTELIKNFCQVFLQRGDRVIIPSPTFSEYEVLSRLMGARVKHVCARDLEICPGKIIKEIDDKTKAVFLCSPNNPTGRTIEGIEEILQASLKKEAFVFLDEAYIEFTGSQGYCKRVGEFENLFVLRSMTKFFSLPGLRVGYGVGDSELVHYLEKVRIPWNVNSLAQAAAIASLGDVEFIEESRRVVKKEREFLRGEIRNLGLKVYGSEANFLLVNLRRKGLKAKDVREKLLRKGLLIRDCSSFTGLDEYFIRVCVRRRGENLRLTRELREVLQNA
jgi:threonine-phosphate decarboxylase